MQQHHIPRDEHPDLFARIFAAVSYVWLIGAVPLYIFSPKGSFVHFHARQGLIITITSFILGVVMWIPIFGQVGGFLGMILVILGAVTGILHAMMGTRYRLPILGTWAEKLS
jgi:uncharacterized membrane protein